MGKDGRTILVVDDGDELALCGRVLALNGYRVVRAGGAEEALCWVSREQPALILLDLALSDAQGLALVRGLRAHPQAGGVPIIAVNALSDTAAAGALAAGCSVFRTKHLEPRSVLDRVNHLLGRSDSNETAMQSSY